MDGSENVEEQEAIQRKAARRSIPANEPNVHQKSCCACMRLRKAEQDEASKQVPLHDAAERNIMRKSILQQIFDGDFCTSETIRPSDPSYRAIGRRIDKAVGYLTTRLDDEDKTKLEELRNLIFEEQHMEAYANFAYGFRTGLLVMYELTSEPDQPNAQEATI